MSRLRILAVLGCLAIGCARFGESTAVALATADAAATAQTQTQTQEALAVVRRMSQFLASRKAMRFDAEIRYDAVQASGQKIEFGSRRRVALRSPEKARVEVTHWDGEQELVTFDGARLSAVASTQRVYASIEFAGSVADAFEHLTTEHGVASPLSDLLRASLADEIASRARSARVIDVVMIDGEACDQLAFRGERVDFQLFVRRGDEPVPLRFLIDYHAEAGRPQFRAQLRGWETDLSLPDSLFRFVPPAGAERVGFAELLDLLLGSLDGEEGGS